MKLLYCTKCSGVFTLTDMTTYCKCQDSWGRYLDELHAEYGGEGVPFGFDNQDLLDAVRVWPRETRSIRCFTIPERCDTFIRVSPRKAGARTETGSTSQTSGSSKWKARRPR